MSCVSQTRLCRSPLMSLGDVCLCLEDQTGASCFTSSAASSRSHIGTNCSNNNTRKGLASQTDGPESGGGMRSSPALGPACRDGRKGGANSSLKRNTRAQVTAGGNWDSREAERPDYVLHCNWYNTDNNAAILWLL